MNEPTSATSNGTDIMRKIELDASNWMTWRDFYDALLFALGAPEYHGRNINALVDSMIWGGINKIEPPYSIRITETGRLPKDVHEHIELAKNALAEGRAEFRALRGRDVQVQFEIIA
jgi:hypothetical protein